MSEHVLAGTLTTQKYVEQKIGDQIAYIYVAVIYNDEHGQFL
jgi:hypothetical protein